MQISHDFRFAKVFKIVLNTSISRTTGLLYSISSMAHIQDNGKEVSVDTRRGDSVAWGVDDVGAIPKGTIDPVYEAKARVLNRAVSLQPALVERAQLTYCRSKTSGWDGINGSSSSLSGSDGLPTTSGPL